MIANLTCHIWTLARGTHRHTRSAVKHKKHNAVLKIIHYQMSSRPREGKRLKLKKYENKVCETEEQTSCFGCDKVQLTVMALTPSGGGKSGCVQFELF